MNFIPQKDQMDCGPACIAMISHHFGKKYPIEFLRDNAFITREGVSLLGIGEASKKIGLESISVKIGLNDLKECNNNLPCILHWNQNHFVVLYKISKSPFYKKVFYHIADPAHGKIKLSEDNFKKSFISDDEKGVAMFLTPSEDFFNKKPPKTEKISISFLIKYLSPYKKQVTAMFLLLLMGSALTLIFPFLTQSLIDKGVIAKNLSFIKMILLAQLGVFLGAISIEIFRNWIMLYIGTHLSIKIIADFLKKMLLLPIKFFDTKTMGDFNQRIQDNERIENFLTSQSLITFFSIISFSVFFGVLWYYDFKILLTYLILTILSILWSLFWMKKRKILDYYLFQQRSENQESIYEILNGVTEMKLNQFEDFKINEWKKIQFKLFKLNHRILKLNQIQLSGFEFLNQLKNIVVTFLAANYVVKGSMTMGMLLSISYIIGQMNSPINQLINFFRSLQDAKLSLERLNEVQNKPNEENSIYPLKKTPTYSVENRFIEFKNVSFQYEGPNSPFVLKDVNLKIPLGKITAIVGSSGSGKTTLIKLLLKFYEPTKGNIYFNGENISDLSPKSIRENTGIVMQDGY
ncbi:ATP-binding cassette domain-containing protein, partial [Ornithobacterium rhinotracheale]|uniref:peptidase domain-containing ABC transporter n=1 Tax=Ornithobacterium rhinotracheale TaxID=28251 RepID=UPI00129C68A4